MNLSQKKREQLLTTIRALREQNTDNSILSDLNEIELELNRKKYGLVWEKHEEEVDKMLVSNIPIFTEVKEKAIIVDSKGKYNFLLEGDNLHSLKLLKKTHKGRINVIYIDPPYNTKNKDFIYNDHQVGEDDSYRHSKWLSFMAERLEIARELLSDDGVIFISIDDNEQAQLKLLCDSIFGENNSLVNMIITTAPAGTQSSTDFAQQHAYCLVYRKSMQFKINNIKLDREELNIKYNFGEDKKGKYYIERLWKRGIGGKKEDVPTLHFPVWYNPETDKIYIDEPEKSSDLVEIIPYHTKGVLGRWTWSKKKMKEEIEDLKVTKVAGEWKLHKKVYNISDKGKKPYSIVDSKLGRTELGTLELKKILKEKLFDYPKYTGLIKYFVSMHQNKNAIVLDFFAGSGTTGHAVELLNKEDGGNRTYILCTNNENGICENITYQRLSKIQEELPHNLKYLKTDFISKENYEMYEELEKHMIEMIELEEGYGIKSERYSIVMNEEELDILEENISNMPKLCTIYKGSSALATGSQEELLRNYVVKNIPEYYYEEELEEGNIW